MWVIALLACVPLRLLLVQATCVRMRGIRLGALVCVRLGLLSMCSLRLLASDIPVVAALLPCVFGLLDALVYCVPDGEYDQSNKYDQCV